METFPNQNRITVFKAPLNNNFIGINKEAWMSASLDLGAIGVQLYTYLGSFSDGYTFALSYQAVNNATGIKKSSYYKYLKILEEKGYLKYVGSNLYYFNEIPEKEKNSGSPSNEQESSFCGERSSDESANPPDEPEIPQNARLIPQNNTDSSQGNREININNEEMSPIDNGIDSEPKGFVF